MNFEKKNCKSGCTKVTEREAKCDFSKTLSVTVIDKTEQVATSIL